MKKLIGFVLGLALAVSSVSAIEFSVGAKANVPFGLYAKNEIGEFDVGMTIGAGVSVIGGIDFLEFGKCKLGTRPEVLFNFKGNDFFNFISVKIPVTFTFVASDSFDWGIGLGYFIGYPDEFAHFIVPASIDFYTDISCGPGKILIDAAVNGLLGGAVPYRIELGVGYLYTF